MTAYVVGDRDKWYRKLLRIVFRVSVIVLFFVAILGWLIYRSAQSLPDFYEAALAVSAKDNVAAGDVFETKALDLQNSARTKKQWQAKFTDAEVNGWLSTDLIEKFPDSLPPNITDPRISIAPNRLSLAVKFQSDWWNAIVVAKVDVFSTDVVGQIALRIESVKAGWLPIPLPNIADQASRALRQSGIQVTWTEVDGVPVALLMLPPDLVRLGEAQVELEAIQLLEEQLVLTGNSNFEGNVK